MIKFLLFFLFVTNARSSCFDSNAFNRLQLDTVTSNEIDGIVNATSIEKASLVIGNSKGVILSKHYGHTDPNLRFDIASLTKLFTAATLMHEIEKKGYSIKQKWVYFLPSVKTNAHKSRVSLEDLLRHRSGYKAGVLLSELDENTNTAWEKIRNLLPSRGFGKYLYSDINYLLLGEAIRAISGNNLDFSIQDNLIQPLGLKNTSFECNNFTCAATSNSSNFLVHDPTSRVLGGIAGHAGLFASSLDLANFISIFLNGGKFCGKKILSNETVLAMTSKVTGSSRGLGFDLTSPYSRLPRGEYFTKGVSFGHTGFTGTSIWVDPKLDVFVIFLTNAIKSQKAKKEFLRVNNQISTLVGKSFYSLPSR